MDISKKKDCQRHKFEALGFSVSKTTERSIEAVAAIFCENCGMFRTKILTFIREFKDEDNNIRTPGK